MTGTLELRHALDPVEFFRYCGARLTRRVQKPLATIRNAS